MTSTDCLFCDQSKKLYDIRRRMGGIWPFMPMCPICAREIAQRMEQINVR